MARPAVPHFRVYPGLLAILLGCVLVFANRSSAQTTNPARDVVGKTVVTGTVTDQHGKALAGATVEWGRHTEPFKLRHRVLADDAGVFSIEIGALEARCHLAASAPGYVPASADSRFGRGRHERNFVLEKTPKDRNYITGTVVDPQGKAIAGALVEAFTPVVGFHSSFSMPTGGDYFPGPDRVATTDADGRFRIENLPAEEVQLNLRAKHRHVNASNYPVRENVQITMDGSGKPGLIQGRIVEAATDEPPADLGSVRIVARYSSKSYECSGDDDGRFKLPIEATLGRDYTVYIYAKRFAPAMATLRAVAPNSSKLAIIELKEGRLLRGKLIDVNTGKPIQDANVLFGVDDDLSYFDWSAFNQYADGYHSLQYVQRAKTNKRGGFWFAEADAASRGTIIVSVDGYQRMILHPDAQKFDDHTGELVVSLQPESAITGVVSVDGKPLANEPVSLGGTPTGNVNNMYESTRTDEQGRFRFGRLAPGAYHVSGGPYTRIATVGESETITLNVGRDLGPIRIVGSAAAGITVTLNPKFDWDYRNFSTVADAAGEYEFSGLKAGKYEVSQHYAYPTSFLDSSMTEIEVRSNNQRIDLMATPDFNLGPQLPAEIEPIR